MTPGTDDKLSKHHGKAAPEAIQELRAALEDAIEYLTPWTLHSAPGEDETYERAQQLIKRYSAAA